MHAVGRLKHVMETLEADGFSCQLREGELPQVEVSLGRDGHHRERTLVVRFDHFLLPADSDSEATIDQVFMHLFVAFPFSFQENAVGELSRFLMSLNKPLEIPGFGLDEVNGLIFFRYSLFTGSGSLKGRTLIALISTIMLLMDALTPQIESVAEGAPFRSVLRTTFAKKAA